MREKGLDYRLNWGVPVIQLKQMAKELGKDYDLAIALWKEDIRECKILATLVMPAQQMPQEVAEIWMEQTHTQEMAEMQALNVYQHVSYAPMIPISGSHGPKMSTRSAVTTSSADCL